MPDYWARVMVAPDHRAFVIEASKDVLGQWGVFVIDGLRPQRWAETLSGIYHLKLEKLGSYAKIVTMDRIAAIPGSDASPTTANDPDPVDGPRPKVADDFGSIARAMKNLGIK